MLAVVGKRVGQDLTTCIPRVSFRIANALQLLDAALLLHLIRELIELRARFRFAQLSTFIVDGNLESEDAGGSNQQSVLVVLICNLKLISKLFLLTQLTGLRRLFMIMRLLGEAPFLERLGKALRDRQRENVFRYAISELLHFISSMIHACNRCAASLCRSRPQPRAYDQASMASLSRGGPKQRSHPSELHRLFVLVQRMRNGTDEGELKDAGSRLGKRSQALTPALIAQPQCLVSWRR